MALSPVDFEYIRVLVLQRSGIVLEAEKAYLAENRITALARVEKLGPLPQVLLNLRQDVTLQQRVVEAMTTNETYFFRDIQPFEMLREHVLPPLIRARAAEQHLTIWSAACSSGQEPYTLAMLLREHFPELAKWRVRILATDLATNVLERAKEGKYSQLEVNRGLPARLLAKYFAQLPGEWQVRADLRQMVEFRPLNLVGPWWAMPRFDVVLLRNVLIYFDVKTRQEILRKVRNQLAPDGRLLLGAAETTVNIDDAFERVEYPQCSCYRLRGASMGRTQAMTLTERAARLDARVMQRAK